MSKIALTPNASGTGIFTIASPNSNTDRTLSLPDETGTVLTSASNVAASQMTTALNATGSAPIYAARAWVNFNGTGTVAIRASGNVTSITDNGTGDYTVNLTNALPDANGSVTSGGFYLAGFNSVGEAIQCALSSTSAVRIRTGNTTVVLDFAFVNIAVFR